MEEQNVHSSFLLRGMSANGTLRIIAADTTELVQTAITNHGASPTAGAALGRTLTANMLLSHALLKDHRDRLTIRVNGNGPLGGIITEGGLDGSVRGYVQHATFDLPLRDTDGKLDVGAAVGAHGDLEVIRSHAPYGDPYSTSVELVSGEIAEDVAAFLYHSEQIPSAVMLGVAFAPDGTVAHAGGIIVQALPDAEDSALTLLEANIRAFGQLTERMAEHDLLHLVSEELTWGMGYDNLTEEPLPLRFACECSSERALNVLGYFTADERQEMIDADGGAEVVCHWCNTARFITAEEITAFNERISDTEVRCPDCGTVWYRNDGVITVRDGEVCSCGRPVEIPDYHQETAN